MKLDHIRNAITLLIVLTACNLAASFAALYAVRTIRAESNSELLQIEATTAYLRETVAVLCTKAPTACPPAPVAH